MAPKESELTEAMTNDDSEIVAEVANKEEETDVSILPAASSASHKQRLITFEEVCEIWSLTDEEKGQLLDLRNRVADVDYFANVPSALVRFLRARPGDVAAAEEMFRNAVKWRLENNMDDIFEDVPEKDLIESFGAAILKDYDNDGDPIFLKRIGSVDGVGIMNRFGLDAMFHYSKWFRELIARGDWHDEYEQRQGRLVHKLTVIVDLQGLNRSHMNSDMMAFFKQNSRMDQDYYPETAKRIIIIRAPMIMNLVWGIAKHFLDAGVKEKLVFAKSDYLKDIDEYLDRDVLPPCVNPEGSGKAAIGFSNAWD